MLCFFYALLAAPFAAVLARKGEIESAVIIGLLHQLLSPNNKLFVGKSFS
jgi:hypothetical protein